MHVISLILYLAATYFVVKWLYNWLTNVPVVETPVEPEIPAVEPTPVKVAKKKATKKPTATTHTVTSSYYAPATIIPNPAVAKTKKATKICTS